MASKSSQPAFLCRFSYESDLGSIWEKFHYTGPPKSQLITIIYKTPEKVNKGETSFNYKCNN